MLPDGNPGIPPGVVPGELLPDDSSPSEGMGTQFEAGGHSFPAGHIMPSGQASAMVDAAPNISATRNTLHDIATVLCTRPLYKTLATRAGL